MAFDLDNSVQQGFNRDPETNDWHVEAENLEIKLGDSGGVRELRVLDADNVGVVVMDSDGYLSVAGNAEVHGGNILVRGESLSNTPFVTLQDQTDEISIHLFDLNPDGTVTGSQGSFGSSYNDGYMYINTDGADKWERLAYLSQVPSLEAVTLQLAYDNDADGGNATITTNATDGSIVFTGTEDFNVTTVNVDFDVTGAISFDADLDSNFTVDGGNLTFEITSSGDIINRLGSPGSDFIVDQGTGQEFIRAETSANELRLGDPTPIQIDVRVLSDLIIDGDLTVQGTTTTVSTDNLFVEDRLIRLNIGTAPSFNGTTGIEMEVGSDGYVEFHWDDAQSRWEISIDRDVTPEAQTFRPLPYLADSPATLDLSNTGDDGFPTAGPNLSAGASVVNTNSTNFPYTFGPDMADDSVQAALEAIDGYFLDLTQDIVGHSEDVANPHSVTFTQAVTADSLTDILASEAETLTDGSDADGLHTHTAVSAHTHAHSDTTGQTADDHHDELHTIASHSDTSATGAELDTLTDGSNADSLHMHAAATATTTLQEAYKNDPNDVAAIIHTDSEDGYVEIAGDQKFMVTATGGFDLDTGFDMDTVGDSLDVNLTAGGSFSLDAYGGASNVTVDAADLTISTTTSGNVNIDAASRANIVGGTGIVLDGNGSNVVPAVDNQDSLGTTDLGWTDVFIRNVADNATVSLVGAGDASASNTTSGAHAVGTNESNFVTFGPDMTDQSVQAALEAIDGYLLNLEATPINSTFSKSAGLELNGAILNGNVRTSTDGSMPALDFRTNKTGRALWSIHIPDDWDRVSDIGVEVIWSPSDADTGNVEWRLEYLGRSLTELVSAASTTDDFLQAAGGTLDALQSTTTNLNILAANVGLTDEVILLNIVRRGTAGTDTFTGSAQIHLVKYSYTANNIIS